MTLFQKMYFFHLNIMTAQLFKRIKLITPHLPGDVQTTQLCRNHRSSDEQRAGLLYLQERPVLGLLLLHLLQQPLDFFPQLCLQLWLDDKVQRGRKRGAQRVNMALQREIKGGGNTILVRNELKL